MLFGKHHNLSRNKKKKNKEENIIKGEKETKDDYNHKRYKYNKEEITNLITSEKITNNYNSLPLPQIELASCIELETDLNALRNFKIS